MRNRVALTCVTVFSAGLFAQSASAAPIITFANQAAFQAALDAPLTLVNLDAAPFVGFASGYRVDDLAPAAAFFSSGIDFVGANAQVVAGQNGQTSLDRDRLIFNGSGFNGSTVNNGNIAVNFVTPVNGVGAFSNLGDGGRIRVFSGADLGGSFLGEVAFGGLSSFGGLVSDVLIGSAAFTCDFNSDLKCGVYDIQFGTLSADAPVPEPASLGLLSIGLAGLGLRRRKRASSGGNGLHAGV